MTEEQIKEKYGYDNVNDFYNEKAVVVKGTRWGHVDSNGNIITPIIYDFADDFYKGKALVVLNGNDGYVDLNGNLYPEYQHIFIQSAFED